MRLLSAKVRRKRRNRARFFNVHILDSKLGTANMRRVFVGCSRRKEGVLRAKNLC